MEKVIHSAIGLATVQQLAVKQRHIGVLLMVFFGCLGFTTNAAAAASTLKSVSVTGYPEVRGVSHSTVNVNGVQLHVAEAGEGPLIIFLHGFPELWYSWRHQLPVVADAGFRAVAPDMRGFGDSSIPDDPYAYDVFDICADVRGLMDHYSVERAVVVGHDWGAVAAFYCAQISPERFAGLVTVSIPYGGPPSDQSPLERMRARFGEDFFYMLYFQEDAATNELNSRTREVFTKLFASSNVEREPAPITDSLATAGGFLDRIGAPKTHPDWISPEEMGYFISTFEATGFDGGLNYYRNFDRNWIMLRGVGAQRMTEPALFISGVEELAIRGRTEQELKDNMRYITPDIQVHLVPGVGHWVQDETSQAFNTRLLEFLMSLELPGD